MFGILLYAIKFLYLAVVWLNLVEDGLCRLVVSE
jgi:hypothetical protein